MFKSTLMQTIQEIQSYFPEELLKLIFIQPVESTDLDELMERILIAYSPVFLPVFTTEEGDIIAVHLKPNSNWQEGIWVKLDHDSAEPRLIASCFKYLPYAFLVAPINIKGYIDEIWNDLLFLLNKINNSTIPDKEYIKEKIDESVEVLAKYDKLGGAFKLSFATRYLEAEEAKELIESLFQELPEDIFTLMGTAIIRSKLSDGDAIGPSIQLLSREVPYGFYSFDWINGDSDSGPEVLELVRPIALPGLSSDNPLVMLKDAPYTRAETAEVLREVAANFREQGEEEQALIQLRNGAAVAGRYSELTKEWCLELAKQAERVEPGCLAAALAYYAVEVLSNNVEDIFNAAKSGDVTAVKAYLETGFDLNNKLDEYDNTVLIIAAQYGRAEIVKFLIENQVEIDAKDSDGMTALMLAAKGGHTDTVRLLLEAGADITVTDHKGWTALMGAAIYGEPEVVKLLLEAKSDVNIRNTSNETALMMAALRGNTAALQLLIEANADVNLKRNDGRTALMEAAFYGYGASGRSESEEEKYHVECVRRLIAAGADANAKTDTGLTTLMITAYGNHLESVELLIAAGADLNSKNDKGATALTLAEGQKHSNVVTLLKKAGAK